MFNGNPELQVLDIFVLNLTPCAWNSLTPFSISSETEQHIGDVLMRPIPVEPQGEAQVSKGDPFLPHCGWTVGEVGELLPLQKWLIEARSSRS